MEENQYLVAKKVATERLPDPMKELMQFDEENLNDERHIERNVDFHANYMQNLENIRNEVIEKQKAAAERQKAFEQMMSFNKKAKKEGQVVDQAGSVETLEKEGETVEDGQN